MTAYSERPFAARYHAMGDTSELIFEQVESGWTRFGLNRPKVKLNDVPPFVRHAPDYLQRHRLVEVVAMGHDGVLKLKNAKIGALLSWEQEFRTDVWVWDGGRKRNQYGACRVPDLFDAICLNGKEDVFQVDGVIHWRIARGDLPIATWTEFEGEIPTGRVRDG